MHLFENLYKDNENNYITKEKKNLKLRNIFIEKKQNDLLVWDEPTIASFSLPFTG